MNENTDNLKKAFDSHHENLKELFDELDGMEVERDSYKKCLEDKMKELADKVKEYKRLQKVTEKLIMTFVKKSEDKVNYRKSAGYKL